MHASPTPAPLPRAPLRFAPVYQQAIWGGSRIASRYARTGTPTVCAESWEISAHPDGEGRVLDGPLAGQSLAALCRAYGRDLLGSAAPEATRFPLLVKLIDARERLSVQVHPNNANAPRTGGEPKTEVWYLLDAAPGAALFAGLTPGTTPDGLRAAVDAGRGGDCLVALPAEPGDALFIPGGLVHAIGAGCLIYEVQQSSNTTYRLDDWGRVGPDGKPRPLHVASALQAIDWSLPPPRLVKPRPAPGTAAANRWAEVVQSPYFRLRRLQLAAREEIRPGGRSFHVLFAEDAPVEVRARGGAAALPPGGSCLLPACVEAYAVAPTAGAAAVLVTTLA